MKSFRPFLLLTFMPKILRSFLEHEETLRRLVLVSLLFIVPALLALEPVSDPDIWWHLRTGQWIIAHGTVPKVDEFSSYGMGKPWVAYSWLFEVLVYGLYQAFGLLGIVLYTVIFTLLIAAALYKLVRRFALNFPAEVALTAVGLLAMTSLYSPRPWLFSILFFLVEVDCIFLARRQGEVKRLFFLPLLFCLWANTHIQFCYGLFVLGLATLEPLVDKFLPPSFNQHKAQSVSFCSLVLVLTACVAATLLTPYHIHLYQTLLDLVQQTGQFRDITELQSLSFRTPWDWCVLAVALGATFSLGWSRALRPIPLLVLATGIFLSFRARRDVWFIVAVATPIIADAYTTMPSAARFPLTKLRIASCAGLLLFALFVAGWHRDLSQAHLEAVVAEYYPASAVAVIQNRGYTGPLYNDYDWGGFLIWSLRTPLVSMDNRANLYGNRLLEQSLNTWTGSEGWDADPDLIAAHLVIANIKGALASLLRLDPRFQLVYEDKVAAVFTARLPSQEQAAALRASQ